MLYHRVYLGLGSNLAEPVEQLKVALKSIGALSDTKLITCSSFYGSKPLGPQDQPDFVNAVCLIETLLSPHVLLSELQNIEQTQGRVKKRHWGERLIDIDILLCDQLCLQTESLTIPHSQMHLRDFVLLPLAEISPGLVIPKMDSVETLIEQLAENFVTVLEI